MAVQTTYPDAPDIGLPGQLRDNGPYDAVTMINMEASASIPFGTAVCFQGSTRDDGALRPDATTDKIAGILLRSLAYNPDTLVDPDSVPPKETLNVLVEGRVYVVCENGCAPGDRLYIRAVAAGAEVEGACRSAADSTNCIDSTNQGIWRTTAAAGAVAALDVDFTNSPTVA